VGDDGDVAKLHFVSSASDKIQSGSSLPTNANAFAQGSRSITPWSMIRKSVQRFRKDHARSRS
jgi:hypothetical protein